MPKTTTPDAASSGVTDAPTNYPSAAPGSAMQRLFGLLAEGGFEYGGRDGDGGNFQCPAHDDHDPSLHVEVGTQVAVVATCRACGASLPQVLDALMVRHELPSEPGHKAIISATAADPIGNVRVEADHVDWGTDFAPKVSRSRSAGKAAKDLGEYVNAEIWTYETRDRKKVRRVIRRNYEHGKAISQDGYFGRVHGWQPKVKGLPVTPLYLEDFDHWLESDDHRLFIVEGEKAADALVDAGYHATTYPGGSGGKLPSVEEVREHFAGFGPFVVWADADEPGLKRAGKVARLLKEAFPSAPVSVAMNRNASKGDDAADLDLSSNLADLTVQIKSVKDGLALVADEGEISTEVEPRDDEAFWNSRPVLARLRDFARARRVSPWALLGCVLARVAVNIPPEIVLPPLVGGDGSLNSFIALCGASGQGKSAATQAADDFLEAVCGLDYLEAGPGSGEGVIASYVHVEGGTKADSEVRMVQHNVSTLYISDEVQSLGALTNRTNSTLLPFLKTAWVGGLLATQNSSRDTNRRVEKHRYRLALVAGVQPEHAGVILDDMGGGFPQRWIWFDTYDPSRLSRDVVADEPERWKWNVPDPMSSQIGAEKPLTTPLALGNRYKMTVPNSVREAVYAAQDANNRPIGDTSVKDTLDGHAVFAREKVAALLALLDERLDVSDEDWELAGVIAAHSDETRAQVIAAHAKEASREADSRATRQGRSASIAEEAKTEADIVRVVRRLRDRLEKSPEGLSKSVLRKTALRSTDRQHFDPAMDRLLASGEVIEDESNYQGQQSTRFRLTNTGR